VNTLIGNDKERSKISRSAKRPPFEQIFARITDEQEHYDRVMAFYLAEQISLSRAAELLSLSTSDLRMRFVRLNIPLRMGTLSLDEVNEDVQNALNQIG
jgi:hypothetical protein